MMNEEEAMGNKSVATKMLAIAGTVLIWFPLLAPLLLAFIALFTGRGFLLDYLMPAEVFPLALAGGVLLLLAALRLRYQRMLVGGSLAVAVGMWFGFQMIAEATGLASGETEMGGWQSALVLAGLAVYILALVVIGVGGVLLLRELFRRGQPLKENP
jgi:hypothetical protein